MIRMWQKEINFAAAGRVFKNIEELVGTRRSAVVLHARTIFFVLFLGSGAVFGQGSCGSLGITLTPDYQFAIGTSAGAGSYSWLLNGQTLASGVTNQLDLLHFDNSLQSTSGLAPAQSIGTKFVPGNFGAAVEIQNDGILAYPAAGNLSVQDGTVEMWVSPQLDGSNSVYTQTPQVLFQYYWGTGSNQLVLALNNNAGLFVGAGTGVSTAGGSVVAWKAGDWHHLAFTYSTTQGRLRWYVDGLLLSEYDTAINLPAPGVANFTVGSDAFGHAGNFAIDELRISNNEATPAQIQNDSSRTAPFGNNEVVLSLNGVFPGQLTYSVTGCGTTTYSYTGIPVTNLSPPTGLLSPGSTTVSVSFNTTQPTTCAYSVGSLTAFSAMKLLDTATTTSHKGLLTGLSPSPQVVNTVYLRCSAYTDYVQRVQYRSVPALNPPFPRISSLWYGSDLLLNNPSKAKEVDLFLASFLSNSQLDSLRELNAGAVVTSGYGATYSPPSGIPYPDNYLLKDIHGQPIEIYPQSYEMNLTKPEVAEFIANLAYQSIVQSNLGLDGIFFDSFNLQVPATFVDWHGNALEVDANGDGVPDDQATLNAAWRAGMLHLIDTFHNLAPNAYTTGHMGLDPDLLPRFNGVSLGFLAADAREGRVPFASLWDNYNSWLADARHPTIVNLQSAPPNQIAYGYGQPTKAQPSLIEFGRTFYPNMRFGLATALMSDGYFNHDLGDATTLVNWWYDEYDFSLGYPLGPAKPLASAPPGLLANGGFEGSLSNWNFAVFNDGQSEATVTLDSAITAEGASSARIAVSAASPVVWHVDLEQDGLTLAKGVGYELHFWARADSPRTITLNSQGGAPGFAAEGLSTTMAITTTWSLYKIAFTASADVTDGRIQLGWRCHGNRLAGWRATDARHDRALPQRLQQRRCYLEWHYQSADPHAGDRTQAILGLASAKISVFRRRHG
jgi:hypothetical protein